MKSPRRRAREFALQGIYQWLLSGNAMSDIEAHMAAVSGFDKADQAFFERLLRGAIAEVGAIEQAVVPHMDRQFAELSPVEKAVLMLGTYELMAHLEAPYKVVLNEAIELAKDYGGADGHKFVNGVLDKLVAELRPNELRRSVVSESL